MTTRRQVLKYTTLAAAGSGMVFPEWLWSFPPEEEPLIYSQQYPWTTYFKREGKSWDEDLEASVSAVASAGYLGFEPTFESPAAVAPLQALLKARQIKTRSLYVNSVLHDPAKVEDSMKQVLAVAKAAKNIGVQIVVTNPSPIRWGGEENKTDTQLLTQAKALNQLGAHLRKMGMTLAYHNHDAEMRNSAREFHHMMLATEVENVALCLDSHWIYRGAGNSQVALFDIVNLYADRVVELHLRQSEKGIWTEVFGPGDIDYERLAEVLLQRNIKPHLVLEQAVETGSPHTMDGVEAHRKGLSHALKLAKIFNE